MMHSMTLFGVGAAAALVGALQILRVRTSVRIIHPYAVAFLSKSPIMETAMPNPHSASGPASARIAMRTTARPQAAT